MNSMFVPERGVRYPDTPSFVAQLENLNIGGTPVGNIGVVERWLEELVLEDHSMVSPQALVNGLQGLVQTILASTQIDLASDMLDIHPRAKSCIPRPSRP